MRQADIDQRLTNLARAPRCGARTRADRPCRQAAVRGRERCRMHGGAKGSGGPRGERNGNFKSGLWTRWQSAGPHGRRSAGSARRHATSLHPPQTSRRCGSPVWPRGRGSTENKKAPSVTPSRNVTRHAPERASPFSPAIELRRQILGVFS